MSLKQKLAMYGLLFALSFAGFVGGVVTGHLAVGVSLMLVSWIMAGFAGATHGRLLAQKFLKTHIGE